MIISLIFIIMSVIRLVAPLITVLVPPFWIGVRSAEYKEHTKQLKEMNGKYRQELDILCDLGEGLKRGKHYLLWIGLIKDVLMLKQGLLRRL
jgi:hypothetical protein